MRKLLASALAITAVHSIANAETFQFQLYQVNPENRTNRTGDFFQDYIFTSRCIVRIADSALQPNAFIDITSSDFESFQCSVEGNDNTYSFDAGSEVFEHDFITDIDDTTQFGLLLDDNGRPLRFESPQVSTSNGFGLFDEPHPEEAFFGQTTGSFLQLDVQSRFDTPFGVLLEPALIGSTPSPRGTITTNPSIIEAGKEFALLNGNFRFIEQSFRDGPNPGDFGDEIENPARFDGFVTFDEKLANRELHVFHINGIFTDEVDPIDPSRGAAQEVKAIRDAFVTPVFSDAKVTLLYNQTESLGDLQELENQLSLLITTGDAIDQSALIARMGTKIDRTVLIDEILSFGTTLTRADVQSAIPEDLVTNAEIVIDQLRNASAYGIIYTYSQGNLYGNILARLLTEEERSRVFFIGIASPATSVGADFTNNNSFPASLTDYSTAREDDVIALARENVLNNLGVAILPANSGLETCDEVFGCHNLVKWYSVEGTSAFEKIRAITQEAADFIAEN